MLTSSVIMARNVHTVSQQHDLSLIFTWHRFLNVQWLVGCFGFNGPLRQYFSLYRAEMFNGKTVNDIGVGRFRILGGPGGGANSQQAHDVVLTSMRRNDVASTSFRRHVPTRFLINQCQIITFFIL